jgi:hypothetical protein
MNSIRFYKMTVWALAALSGVLVLAVFAAVVVAIV